MVEPQDSVSDAHPARAASQPKYIRTRRSLMGRSRSVTIRDHLGMCGMCLPIQNLTIQRMPSADMSSIMCWPPPLWARIRAQLTFGDHRGRAAMTLFSYASRMPKEFSDCLTHKNRLAYAQLHGYEYCEARSPVTTVTMNTAWHKLVAVQGLLR
eukprot:4734228-Prymnesium_polylepis.1